jgi:hypothetical protein
MTTRQEGAERRAAIDRPCLVQCPNRLGAIADQSRHGYGGVRLILPSSPEQTVGWLTSRRYTALVDGAGVPPRGPCAAERHGRTPDTHVRGIMRPSPYFCGLPVQKAPSRYTLREPAHPAAHRLTLAPGSNCGIHRKSVPGIAIFNVQQRLHLGLARY